MSANHDRLIAIARKAKSLEEELYKRYQKITDKGKFLKKFEKIFVSLVNLAELDLLLSAPVSMLKDKDKFSIYYEEFDKLYSAVNESFDRGNYDYNAACYIKEFINGFSKKLSQVSQNLYGQHFEYTICERKLSLEWQFNQLANNYPLLKKLSLKIDELDMFLYAFTTIKPDEIPDICIAIEEYMAILQEVENSYVMKNATNAAIIAEYIHLKSRVDSLKI